MASQDPNAQPITFAKPSGFLKLNPFSKKAKLLEDKTPLATSPKAQVLAEEKKKFLIMKNRKMTEEEVDAYLMEKKANGNGTTAQGRFNALGWALAPARV